MDIEKINEILDFFEPVQLKHFTDISYFNDEGCLGKTISVNSLSEPINTNTRFDVAIFSVNQFLNSPEQKKGNAPQLIRQELYKLRNLLPGSHIADFGTLKTGKNIKQTLAALNQACSLFYHLKKNVIVIGGQQLLTNACFTALKEFENNINLVQIDAKIDLSTQNDSLSAHTYLNEIIEKHASHLYNISCAGYQYYLTDKKQINILNDQYFEHYRLGSIRQKFENLEPVLRDADIASFDISAVRMSDAPAQADGSPNGFYAEEACRIARYLGMSDRIKNFGLYEIDARFDINKQTIKLAAQIIWHYIDGFTHRKHEFPKEKITNYTKYEVQIDEIDFPIVFYRSTKTERWWLEVKRTPDKRNSHELVIVSCSAEDYNSACRNEIPERWWINFKKLK